MARFEAVIFDLYGTLVDFSLGHFLTCLGEMAACLALPSDAFESQFRPHFLDLEFGRLSVREAAWRAATELGSHPEPSQLDAANDRWTAAYRESLAPRAGAIETLTRLRDAGLRLGLITNAVPTARELWLETPFAKLIEVPVFSAEAGLRKPDRLIYELALEHLGLPASVCLFVGDGGSGELAGAVEAGMSALQIALGGEDEATLLFLNREPWQDPIARTYEDVLNFALSSA